MLHTTFSRLFGAGACTIGYRRLARSLGGIRVYGKDAPIPLSHIVESNGLQDALWCLRAVVPGEEAEALRVSRLLALECAERVLPVYERQYPNDPRVRDCLAITHRFLTGDATKEELRLARRASDASYAAADAYADAAYAAADADADADAKARERKWQTERFLVLLLDGGAL